MTDGNPAAERSESTIATADDESQSATGVSGSTRLFGRWTPWRCGFALLTVLALAAALRFVPLYWSPHPATLDGFGYAWYATEALSTGAYPLSAFRVDSFVFSGLLAALGGVLGVSPLGLTQPVASLVGTAGLLAAVVVARRVLADYGWPRRRRALAVLLAGALLAVDGIYLRRTMVADEEVLAYVLLPLLVLALHRWLAGGGRRWLALALVPLVAFPVLHVLSTLVAGLSVLALLVAHAARRPTRRTLLFGGGLVAAFWLYVGIYYSLAQSSPLLVPYVDRVTAYPGVFLAWVIVLALGAAWFQVASSRARTLSILGPLATFYAVAVANAVVAVFPSTAKTPTALLAPILALTLLAAFAGIGAGTLSTRRPAGAMVVALLLGPLAIVGFSLTASLTPEYFGTVTRAQTFLHPPAAIVAGVALARLAAGGTDRSSSVAGRPSIVADRAAAAVRSRRPAAGTLLRGALVVVVVLATVGSLPLAYLTLDTASYPSTTLDSEHRAVGFLADHWAGPWATDHSLSRVAVLWFRDDPSVSAAARWLRGGDPPGCPTLSQRSWTTTGAHLFPGGPGTVSPAAYDRWTTRGAVIYANTGRDPVTIVRPGPSESGC